MQIVSTDPFASLFVRYAPRAKAFYAGTLCAPQSFSGDATGYLHVLHRGRLRIERPHGAAIELSEPSLVMLPLGEVHNFRPDFEAGADLTCAEVQLWGGRDDPVATLLPTLLVVPLASLATIAPTLGLLFDEAFADRPGRQPALDRLFEYLAIQLLRHVVERGLIEVGILAGLADQRLVRALTAMHANPEKNWLLDDLARLAGMSRSRFAALFRSRVGVTPIDYLGRWRISRAQLLLRDGKAIKAVAAAVGYNSAAAFTRAFAKLCGRSPRTWAAISTTTSPGVAAV